MKRVREPKPIGRPRLPRSLLTPGGLAKRLYNDAIKEKKALSAIDALASMAASAVAAEAEAAVRRARKDAALKKQLSERNPAANGPAALILRAASRVECDEACGLCCDSAPDVLVQSMRCCGNACCAPCLSTWLRGHGQYVPRGYGDADYYLGVDEACAMRESATYAGARGRGREIMARMNTHRCPWCRCQVQSVRRGLVSCVYNTLDRSWQIWNAQFWDGFAHGPLQVGLLFQVFFVADETERTFLPPLLLLDPSAHQRRRAENCHGLRLAG